MCGTPPGLGLVHVLSTALHTTPIRNMRHGQILKVVSTCQTPPEPPPAFLFPHCHDRVFSFRVLHCSRADASAKLRKMMHMASSEARHGVWASRANLGASLRSRLRFVAASTTLIDGASHRPMEAPRPSVVVSPPPPTHQQAKTAAYCRRIGRRIAKP